MAYNIISKKGKQRTLSAWCLDMKVQKIVLKGDAECGYILLDDSYVPVEDVNAWLLFLQRVGKSPNTVKNYAESICQFYRFMEQKQLDPIHVFDTPGIAPIDLFSEFMFWLQYPDLTGNPNPIRKNVTVNHIMDVVISFYDYLTKAGRANPLDIYRVQRNVNGYAGFLSELMKETQYKYANILKMPEPSKYVNGITREQYNAMVKACRNRRDAILIGLMFEGGLREGEALGAHVCDLDRLQDHIFRIVPRKNNENGARVKNYASGIVYLPDYLVSMINEYLINDIASYDSDFLFLNLYGSNRGKPENAANLRDLFDRLGRKLDIHPLHPHMCRHGFGKEKLNSGWSYQEVQAYLRHRDIASTKIYAQYTDEKKIIRMREFLDKKHVTLP